MKKSLFVFTSSLLFLCLMPLLSQAQETDAPRSSRFGVKAGVNFANLRTNNADNKMLTGINIGVFGKIPIVKMVAFQTELNFTAKGSEVTYKGAFANGTARFKLNYLEVPLLLVVNINDNFNIHLGTYGSFLINGKVKNASTVGVFDFEKQIDTDDFNNFDAGIAAGVGLDAGAVSLGLRYNYGLKRVGNEKQYSGTAYTFPDAKNGVLNLYLALSLN